MTRQRLPAAPSCHGTTGTGADSDAGCRCTRSKGRPCTPAELVGHDVELRAAAGGIHRGRLVGAGADWLTLRVHSTGRLALVRSEAVSAIVDEGDAGGGEPGDELRGEGP
jgi:hypothetical protein